MRRVRRVWVAAILLPGIALVALADAALGGRVVATPLLTLGTVVAAYLVGAWLAPRPAILVLSGAAVLLTAANQRADAGHYTAANDLFFFAVLVAGLGLAGNLISARAAQVRELRTLTDVRA